MKCQFLQTNVQFFLRNVKFFKFFLHFFDSNCTFSRVFLRFSSENPLKSFEKLLNSGGAKASHVRRPVLRAQPGFLLLGLRNIR